MLSKHSRLIVVVLSVLFSTVGFAASWSDQVKLRIDDHVQANFRNRSQVGIVVGVMRGDQTYVWSYGERVFGSGEPTGGDVFFEIGSITKTYTTTLLALEVLQGRVRLEDQVKSLWPELDGVDAGDITLEQLATHRSGLSRMPDNFLPADPVDPFKSYDEARLFDCLRRFRQTGQAPFDYQYSNLGMGLLGYLLSKKLNNENFENYIYRNLLSPLGLDDTKVTMGSMDLFRVAQGYGNFFDLIPLWDFNVLDSAGALKSTVNDLLKYVRFNMNTDLDLLGQAAVLAQAPRASTDVAGVSIGLGWHSTKLGESTITSHGGSTGGYRANLVFDKSTQLGAVVLSNTNMPPGCVLAPVFDIECMAPEWMIVDSQLQKKFVGSYYSELFGMTIEVFLENGFLGIQPDGQPKLRLWAKSEAEYKIPDAQATIVFTANERGQVDLLTLRQGGHNFEFIRKQ